MTAQLRETLAQWPAEAVHDTVAAIMRQPAFQRDVRTSLLDRVFGWVVDLVQRLIGAAREVPGAKWIVLALGVLVVLAIAARAAATVRARAGDPGATDRRGARVRTAANPWDEAERLAAEGRYAEAAHALYRALLAAVARRERLRIDPSKTSGDYARELRARGSGAYASFRQFGRRYDRLLFATGVVEASEYAALRTSARELIGEEGAA